MFLRDLLARIESEMPEEDARARELPVRVLTHEDAEFELNGVEYDAEMRVLYLKADPYEEEDDES